MRRDGAGRWLGWTVFLGVTAAAPGCSVLDDDCSTYGTCPADTDGAAGGDAGAGAGGHDGGDGDGHGGVDGDRDADGSNGEGSNCDGTKSPAEAACVIDEAFGVFVSPTGSDASGSGTRGAPYASIAKGLLAAKGGSKRVYVCDDGKGYTEQVAIDLSLDGLSMFGGFSCNEWSYATTRHSLVKPAASPVLTVKGLSAGVLLADFEFDAPDAEASGASSIGAIVQSAANIVLRRVKVSAGKAGNGQPGTDAMKGDDGPSAGSLQHGADATCPAGIGMQNGGAWSSESLCHSLGGKGGPANQGTDGFAGLPGDPRMSVTPAGINNRGHEGPTGGDGTRGSDGDSGGLGIANKNAGIFSNSGYSPPTPGGDGADGFPGQGGGGGGASNATGTCIGASGGAGGMGGCGGKHGTGGASGGASVAVLSWSSELTLDSCELTAHPGGGGGKGGNGGPGGDGKDGAEGGAAYAGDAGPLVGKGGHGGPGGNGGPGGPGAGGNGGPSYALAYKPKGNQPPAKLNGTILTPGTPGAKGSGGSAASLQAPDGITGAAAAEFVIP